MITIRRDVTIDDLRTDIVSAAYKLAGFYESLARAEGLAAMGPSTREGLAKHLQELLNAVDKHEAEARRRREHLDLPLDYVDPYATTARDEAEAAEQAAAAEARS